MIGTVQTCGGSDVAMPQTGCEHHVHETIRTGVGCINLKRGEVGGKLVCNA